MVESGCILQVEWASNTQLITKESHAWPLRLHPMNLSDALFLE